jgi:hypothetical protein
LGLFNVSNYAVLEAICNGFLPLSEPRICDNTQLVQVIDEEVNQGKNISCDRIIK